MVGSILLLAALQIPMDRDPIEATTLRKDEIARVYKYGGRAVDGVYRSLVVIRDDGTAIVKTATEGARIGLPQTLVDDIKRTIRDLDASRLTAKPKEPPTAPSTYDGVDVYLTVRKGSKEVSWSNVRYEGDSDMPILENLRKVETLFTRSRMRHDR
jgi:hypothetical protein